MLDAATSKEPSEVESHPFRDYLCTYIKEYIVSSIDNYIGKPENPDVSGTAELGQGVCHAFYKLR